jgi:hypothetical protein
MPGKPNSVVTGRYSPFIDKKTSEQVQDPQKGKKWRITVELPRRGHKQKRPRKYRAVYGSERMAKLETQKFITEMNVEINQKTIPECFNVDASKITFGEHLQAWLETNKNNGLKRRTWEAYDNIARNHLIPCLGHITLMQKKRMELILRMYLETC